MKRPHLLALAGLHLLFYVLYFTPRLREDAPYYYEPLRSAFFDRDLNYYDERPFTRKQGTAPVKLFVAGPNAGGRPMIGGPNNSFDVGTTMLEVPFFLAGHAVARLAGSAASGYSAPYLHMMQLGFLATALASMVTLYGLAISEGSDPGSAFWATAFVSFGTFLPAYVYEDTLLSHLPSFAAATLFFALLAHCRKGAAAPWLFALGSSFAWLVMARRQNLLFGATFAALLPVVAPGPGTIRRLARTTALVGAGFFVFLAPELFVWKIAYGHFFENPNMATLRSVPVFGRVLFSDHGGLYSHSPVLIAATAGLCLLPRRGRLWGTCLVAGVALQQLLNALRVDWWPGIGFGNRRSDSCLPIFALGLAALLSVLARPARSPWPRRGLIALLLFLSAWNMAFLPQFYSGDRIAEKGRHFFSYAAHRSPAQAKIRWPFPPLSEVPALLAEDAAIVRASSFTFSGSARAVAMLAIVVAASGAVLAIARLGAARPVPRALAIALPSLIAIPCTLWLGAVLLHQRWVIALYYDPPEPVERLRIASSGPFRGGVVPMMLAPGQGRTFRLPDATDVTGFELVTAPAPAETCLEVGGQKIAIPAGGSPSITFPNRGDHRVVAAKGRLSEVAVTSCGSVPVEIYGLAALP
ncbi:MAG: hypothetical protein U0166_05005 [Acidobacteriota bacterium]